MKRNGVRALFLDRDGVINRDTGYPKEPGDIEFLPGIFELIRTANEKLYKVLIVTNQAGIGRGLYTEKQFFELMDWMQGQFNQKKCFYDDYYFCAYHPTAGIGIYKKESYDRKPNPGMILRAALAHQIDLAESILVGDKLTDVEAGRAAGIKNNYLLNWTDMQTVEIELPFRAIQSLSEVVL